MWQKTRVKGTHIVLGEPLYFHPLHTRVTYKTLIDNESFMNVESWKKHSGCPVWHFTCGYISLSTLPIQKWNWLSLSNTNVTVINIDAKKRTIPYNISLCSYIIIVVFTLPILWQKKESFSLILAALQMWSNRVPI